MFAPWMNTSKWCKCSISGLIRWNMLQLIWCNRGKPQSVPRPVFKIGTSRVQDRSDTVFATLLTHLFDSNIFTFLFAELKFPQLLWHYQKTFRVKWSKEQKCILNLESQTAVVWRLATLQDASTLNGHAFKCVAHPESYNRCFCCYITVVIAARHASTAILHLWQEVYVADIEAWMSLIGLALSSCSVTDSTASTTMQLIGTR
jgi:hypothetical protein